MLSYFTFNMLLNDRNMCYYSIIQKGFPIMKLKTAICDDEPEISSKLASILNSYEIIKNIDLHVDIFPDGQTLIDSYKLNDSFNILFIDIEMPGMNGIQTTEYIKNNLDRNVFVIFITYYDKYIKDSFSVHPYQYLQKPLNKEQVFSVVDSIVKDIYDSHILKTIIEVGDKAITVNVNDILYIQSEDARKELISFHFFDTSKIIKSHGLLSKWEAELTKCNFTVCCRGLLVNLMHIHYFERSNAVLDNGESLHISRANERRLRELYLNRIVVLKNN